MNNEEYKRYHEAFMRNNNGTTLAHTFQAILSSFLLTIIAKHITIRFASNLSHFAAALLEICIIVIPLVLLVTILSDFLAIVTGVYSIIIARTLLKTLSATDYFNHVANNVDALEEKVYVTNSRSVIYLYTVLCILAVDFNVFPRYFAKTETYGYSLMDTGVAFFMFSSAIISKAERNGTVRQSSRSNLKVIVISAILGIIRFVTISSLDYQQHISEYGVHWNFFITLAVTKFITYLLISLVKYHSLLPISVIVLVMHEIILKSGIGDWVLSNADRDNFVSANREGIFSCFGYVFVYLFTTYIACAIWHAPAPKLSIIKRLFLITFVLWLLTFLLDLFIPPSRRLANSTYCIYVTAISFTMLFLFYIMETMFYFYKETSVPVAFKAINRNGLLYFLTANVLTGLINLSIQTLLVDDYLSLVIITLYMVSTTVIIVYLSSKKITL